MYITYCLRELLEHVPINRWPWHWISVSWNSGFTISIIAAPFRIRTKSIDKSWPTWNESVGGFLHQRDQKGFISSIMSILLHFVSLGEIPPCIKAFRRWATITTFIFRDSIFYNVLLWPPNHFFLYFFLSLLHESVGKLTIDQKERKRKLRYWFIICCKSKIKINVRRIVVDWLDSRKKAEGHQEPKVITRIHFSTLLN